MNNRNCELSALVLKHERQIEHLEQRIADLKDALNLAMIWLDDEVPKYIVDELINSLR